MLIILKKKGTGKKKLNRYESRDASSLSPSPVEWESASLFVKGGGLLRWLRALNGEHPEADLAKPRGSSHN